MGGDEGARVGERLLGSGDLPSVAGGRELAQSLAERRTAGNVKRRGQLVASPEGRGRAIRAPAQGIGEHRPGQAHVRLDRLEG